MFRGLKSVSSKLNSSPQRSLANMNGLSLSLRYHYKVGNLTLCFVELLLFVCLLVCLFFSFLPPCSARGYWWLAFRFHVLCVIRLVAKMSVPEWQEVFKTRKVTEFDNLVNAVKGKRIMHSRNFTLHLSFRAPSITLVLCLSYVCVLRKRFR